MLKRSFDYDRNIKRRMVKNPGKNIMAGIVVALALIPRSYRVFNYCRCRSYDRIICCFHYCYRYSNCWWATCYDFRCDCSSCTGCNASQNGVQYLFAATILMGLIQLLLGILKVGRLLKFYSTLSNDWICECIRYYDFYLKLNIFLVFLLILISMSQLHY